MGPNAKDRQGKGDSILGLAQGKRIRDQHRARERGRRAVVRINSCLDV